MDSFYKCKEIMGDLENLTKKDESDGKNDFFIASFQKFLNAYSVDVAKAEIITSTKIIRDQIAIYKIFSGIQNIKSFLTIIPEDLSEKYSKEFFDYIENIRSCFENEIAKILVEDKIKTILTYNFYASDKQLKDELIPNLKQKLKAEGDKMIKKFPEAIKGIQKIKIFDKDFRSLVNFEFENRDLKEFSSALKGSIAKLEVGLEADSNLAQMSYFLDVMQTCKANDKSLRPSLKSDVEKLFEPRPFMDSYSYLFRSEFEKYMQEICNSISQSCESHPELFLQYESMLIGLQESIEQDLA
jgi:hypothetical protein